MSTLIEQFREYGAWRAAAGDALREFVQWLRQFDVQPQPLQQRLGRMLERLSDERLTIAFVAEFSRGKSELINALFFSDRGRRILPSGAGRTTMCPTEFFYDRRQPIGIRLLPIETRISDRALTDFREEPDAWLGIEFDPSDTDALIRALSKVREVRRVTVEEARTLGLYDETDTAQQDALKGADGLMEVPVWRHALVNMPHPLLEAGLAILDTPGLNALGAEPDLTLNLIPGAHAVVCVLGADTGVTRSDADLWRRHVCATTAASGRWVVLNKIDGLWDPLKTHEEIRDEIEGQRHRVSETLKVDLSQVFALSAQQGLVGRVRHDRLLVQRSGLAEFERALSGDLLPGKRRIVAGQLRREFEQVADLVRSPLVARGRALDDTLTDLGGLRGKNRSMTDQLAQRLKAEREEFEGSVKRLVAVRSVVGRQAQALYDALSVDGLKRHVRTVRERMVSSKFSSGLRDAMTDLVLAARTDFGKAQSEAREINALTEAVFRAFQTQHGLVLPTPPAFSMQSYMVELDRIEQVYERHFGTKTILTIEQLALTRRFIETIASRLRRLYETAAQEADTWVRALLSPVEAQVTEHKAQLKRRLDAVRRIADASQSLEQRIGELESLRSLAARQLGECEERLQAVFHVLDSMASGAEAYPRYELRHEASRVLADATKADAAGMLDAMIRP